jgi:hypothetical protein
MTLKTCSLRIAGVAKARKFARIRNGTFREGLSAMHIRLEIGFAWFLGPTGSRGLLRTVGVSLGFGGSKKLRLVQNERFLGLPFPEFPLGSWGCWFVSQFLPIGRLRVVPGPLGSFFRD